MQGISRNRLFSGLCAAALLAAAPGVTMAATSSTNPTSWTVNHGPDWTPPPPSTNPFFADDNCTGSNNNSGVWAEFTFPSLAIPGTDVINGIEVKFKYRINGDNTAQLKLSGSNVGDTRTVPRYFGGQSNCSSTSWVTSGGSSDLWGTTLTAADFNSGNISVRITKGGPTFNIDAVELVVHHGITNTPPTANAGGPYNVSEGGSVALDGSGSSDAEDSNGDLTFEWDLDNDGAYDDATGETPNFSAAGRDGPDSQTIGLKVTDTGGLSDTSSSSVTINNVAPSIDSITLSSASINEGQSVTVSGTYSDPGVGDTHSGTAIWSDGASTALTANAGSFSTMRNFPDDDPTGTPSDTFTVDITVNDDDGGSSGASTSPVLTVNNLPPTANNDGGVGFTTDEDTSFTTANVLDNDTDPGTDTLAVNSYDTTGTVGLVTNNDDGTFGYDPNGMFEYLGTGDVAYDTFTYTAVDDDTGVSGSATVTITINGVNDIPVITSVTPASQTSDYSDDIGQVTIMASDVDSHPLTLTAENPPGLPSALSISAADCTDNGNSGTDCAWTMDGQVLVPGDNVHNIDFVANDSEADSDCSAAPTDCRHVLTVQPEDAIVMLDENNDVATEVEDEGGDSGTFTLMFSAWETNDPDFPHSGSADSGDLNNMVPFMTLIPVGPGGPVDGTCSFTGTPPNPADGYDQVAYFACDFDGVPVNVYEVVAAVDGADATTRYYAGSDDDVFVVFDPSLGFTTGGGWFYWPETADPGLLTCGPDGYAGDKTNFGFNMKYNKKRKNVQGSLLMMRHTVDGDCLDAGSYRVKSNALTGMALGDASDGDGDYGWSAFLGKATYREPGQDNTGGNAFTAYVEDHGGQGCNQDPSDTFWIEVTDKDDVLLLQLNGPDPVDNDPVEGADGDDEPIECGNIVVPHKPGGQGGGKP